MLPDFLIVKSFDITSRRNAVTSESRSLISLTRNLSGQRWDCRFRIEVAPWEVARARGFLFSLQEDDETVAYSDDGWTTGLAPQAVTENRSSGALEVPINNASGLFQGSFLNFSNHPKLYMVTSVSGNTVRLNTRLVSDITTSHNAILDEPTVQIELAPELKTSARFSSALTRELSNFNLRMQEALR